MSTTRKTLVTIITGVAISIGIVGCALPATSTIGAGQQGVSSSALSSLPSSRSVPSSTSVPSVVLDDRVTSRAADAAIDDMHSTMQQVVLLYIAAGDSVSRTEATLIANALDDSTAATTAALPYVDRNEYSYAQMIPLSAMADAGKAVCEDIGALVPNIVIERDWADFDSAYRDYQAAS